MESKYTVPVKGNYVLKNVRLETGFINDENGVTGTQTELFCIEIKDGKIKKYLPTAHNQQMQLMRKAC